jgi:hypothetical protein
MMQGSAEPGRCGRCLTGAAFTALPRRQQTDASGVPANTAHRQLTRVDERVMIAFTMRRTVVLFSLTMIVLGPGAAAVLASPVRRGATYDGRGRQPHFSVTPSAGGPDGSFIVRLVVARSGRRVKSFVWGLPVACHSGYNDAMSYPGSADIRRDGTFRARLPASNSASRLTMTGRFFAHGLARGTLHYQGGGPLKGCNASGIWTVHVKPLSPPVQQFVGTTDQETQVTFERTIERTPHVTRFSFGSLQTNCGAAQVTTGTKLGPPFDVQFAIPVHQSSFSGDYFDEAFDIKITGRFGAGNSVSGTVTYGDRGGCNTGDVQWTANPAASPSG